MKDLYIILFITFGFSSSVISQEQFALKAIAPEGNHVNGREYIPLSNALIGVELAYDSRIENKLLFDLVVRNDTDHPISVSPGSFYYLNLDDPDADSSRFPPGMAISPLKPYKWHDFGLDRPQHEAIFSPFLEIPAMFMEAFVNPWGIPSSGNAMQDQERVSQMKDIIRQHMMQEVELAPGETVNGFVWFPGPPETKYLLFCIPLEDQEFQFAYELKKARR